MRAEPVPPGVTFLDHTADVGLDVTAPTLEELFARTAAGMACLIHGGDRFGDVRRAEVAAKQGVAADPGAAAPPGGASGDAPALRRRVTLSADDLPALLRVWLREVLHWHEAEGLTLRGAAFAVLTETVLEATATLAPDTLEPIREIKGVTLHGLAVERRGEGWGARVIFDV